MIRNKIFIDLETGGLDPNKNPILQIAGIVEIGGEVKEEFDLLLHPFQGQEIEESSLEVFKYSREEISNFPMPDVQFRNFINILSKYVDYWKPEEKFNFYGYNSKFDEGFLRQFFKNNALNRKSYESGNGYGNFFRTPSIDVMVLAAEALEDSRRDLKNFQLGYLYENLFSMKTEWHNALEDIRATRKLYYKVMEMLKIKEL